eukprot:Gb_27207 [translate_table: standard]
MSSPGLSWLCNFLQESRSLNIDNEANGLSKEQEREMLIALSKVCRRFQDLETYHIHEFGLNDPIDDIQNLNLCTQGQDASAHNCLQLVTKTLVVLLVLENTFVSHASAKTLLVLSNYLVKSVSEWKGFLHCLWISLKGVCFSSDTKLFNDAGKSSQSNAIDQKSSTSDSIDTKVALYIRYLMKDIYCFDSTVESIRLKKCWSAASWLMQLLRNILKTCHVKTGKLTVIYLHIAEAYILDVATLVLNKLCLEETVSSVNFSSDHFLSEGIKGYLDVQNELALGAFLQLLCSFVHIITSEYSEVEGGNLLNQWPILLKVNGLVPALSIQSLAVHKHPESGCISHFLRHKLMMLMIRLSDCFLQKPSTFVLWLEVLWKHAADLLGQSLPGDNKIHESSLVGSPFGTFLNHSDRDFLVSTSHLQRRAVFLLFKCSFILIREDVKTPEGRTSFDGTPVVIENETGPSQLNPISELNREKAAAALMDWLLKQMPCASAFDNNALRSRCNDFASSFLQLFMDEDDLMFEMLLQLLNLPLPLQQVQYGGNKDCMDACLQLLDALKPNLLFHVFLAGVHYDHLVLVDYLISKGTGILFLRYLLRCLRIVCDSWPNFIEFSVDTDDKSNFKSKRRPHHLARNEHFDRHPLSALEMCMLSTPGSITSQIAVQSKDELESGHTTSKRKRAIQFLPISKIMDNGLEFESAKRCLLSLKDAIESLHHKDLFPYNPSALLKRLETFLQLCSGCFDCKTSDCKI